MALRQSQSLKLLQKLSPQQIQLMKLLQLPTLALEEKIKEELELNPALEEDDNTNNDEEELYSNDEAEDNGEEAEVEVEDFQEKEVEKIDDKVEMEDYMGDEEMDSYKYDVSNKGADNDVKEYVVVQGPDFHDLLEQQLGVRNLDETEYTIGLYLIGCIDEDGYVRRELELIVDDLAFSYNINTNIETITKVLKVIQEFDPAGVGARNLQECLLIQLDRKKDKTKEVLLAMDVVRDMMEDFSRKHYEKITRRLNIDDEDLKDVIAEITHLNPRPGTSGNTASASEVIPDFVIAVVDGKPELSINSRNLPDLKISKEYIEMLKEYSREKQKRERSQFIHKIKNRKCAMVY